MKKSLILLPVLAALFLVALFMWLGPNSPRFSPARSPIQVGAYDFFSYPFLFSRPFEGGKTWILVAKTNEYHNYLYDLEGRKVLGELLDAEPLFLNRDQTKVLAVQRETGAHALKSRIVQFLSVITGGRIQIRVDRGHSEHFWLVNLGPGSARKMGALAQDAGGGSMFVPSPDLHYAYTKPTSSFQKPEFVICDLEKGTMRMIPMDGWPQAWWDDRQIAVKTGDGGFVLLDVEKGSTNMLLNVDVLQMFFETNHLDLPMMARLSLFPMLAGGGHQFFLTDNHQRWLAKESYLLRLKQPGPELELVNPKFKFEWSDHFDATGSSYAFSGREAGQGSSAVYLRNLATGETRTLVEDNGTKLFSLPNFYGTNVIYSRSNQLWRVDFTGRNHERVFPPPEAPESR